MSRLSKNWGERLTEIRKRKFATRKAFVAYAKTNRFDISAQRYGRLERDERKPTIDEIYDIAVLLGANTDEWILGRPNKRFTDVLSDHEREIISGIAELLVERRKPIQD